MRLHVCHLRTFSGLSFAFSRDSNMDSGDDIDIRLRRMTGRLSI